MENVTRENLIRLARLSISVNIFVVSLNPFFFFVRDNLYPFLLRSISLNERGKYEVKFVRFKFLFDISVD